MIKNRFVVALGVVAAAVTVSSSVTSARELSFDDRVAAQKAIEHVYWSHRIWPKANPLPKPPLSSVMSDEAIRAEVEDYLKKSNALETYWQRPITHEQLQAELDRMARDTHDPRVLSELFAALGNDPFTIAETLARQALADRLIRNWYAADTRFHGNVRRKAEAALAACAGVDCMKSIGGEYRQARVEVSRLEPEEWNETLDQLATRFGTTVDAIPSGRLSRLEETADAFVVSAVVSRRAGEVTTASVAWPKQVFDNWWSVNGPLQRQQVASEPAFFVLPEIALTGCANDTWMPTGIGSIEKRRYHTAVWTGTEMIVWGGEGGAGIPVVTGGRYNPAIDGWRTTSTVNGPSIARRDHTAVWTGTEMIIWGGYSGTSNMLTGGYRYDPTTDTWTKDLSADPIEARAGHTAVWTGTEMIVWGGYYVDAGGTHFLNSGGRYDPLGDYFTAWTPTSTDADVPEARRFQTGIWSGSELIVWGGESSSGLLNTGGRYDPSSDSWTATSTDGPTARYRHSAVWTGAEMIIWGGQNDDATDSGGRYNPTTDAWAATPTSTNVPSPRFWHSAVWTGTEMIIWGGNTGTADVNTGGRFNPATTTWMPTSVGTGAPAARFGFSTVWTGAEMIVWGGYISGVDYTNDGGRYDPSTDSWVPTATGEKFPDPRTNHTAVWTGTEMIIWGGSTLNSGSRYNPSLDHWSATSELGDVPSPRSSHSAVWTGTEMIVWGGFNGSVSVATGGRYNPTTNFWTPMPTGAPTARYLHTAVWTGTEMIVWGGRGDTSTLTTAGARYNPNTNAWIATAIPPLTFGGRFSHTAVWTGKDMIVWGGDGCTGTPFCALGSGSRYDPLTDTWAATSTGANTPGQRWGHTALWTGTEMIVWGGRANSPVQQFIWNTGARYNPTTDSWLPTSTGANVPSGRYWHSGVWTGGEMIVWGGNNGTSNVSSGGRYNPGTDGWTQTSTVNGPSSRSRHTAAWSGSEMIVWGGTPLTPAGGRYCACPNGRTVYRDADADGYGDPALLRSSNCDGSIPSGYSDNGTDCNDANAAVHPNAPEVNDGVDNQCIGEEGFGLIDEISGSSGFGTAGDKTRYSWPAQPGATGYDVARSTSPGFSSGCTSFPSSDPFIVDPESPAAGTGFYYLVRSSAPHVGTWGQRGNGSPRVGVCLTP